MTGLKAISLFAAVVVLLVGCDSEKKNQPAPPPANVGGYGGGYNSYGVDPKEIRFSSDVTMQPAADTDLRDLTFVDKEGQAVALKDLLGNKTKLVVVTRGYPGEICIYCSTQVARLIAQYDKITAHDAEVVVIFPVSEVSDKQTLDDFIVAAQSQLDDPTTKVPFPILLDVELKAVTKLGILKDLSKPATYIVDQQGVVRFAYVGDTVADRPSIEAIVRHLEKLKPVAPARD